MNYSDEILSAFIDGELPSHELAAIESDMQEDPVLCARVARLKSTDETLRAAYSGIVDETPPARLLQPFKYFEEADMMPRHQSFLSRAVSFWPAALAASVALVIGYIGANQFQADPQMLATAGNNFRVLGAIADNHEMFEPFESGESAQSYDIIGQDDLKVELILSFKSVSGNYCREFLVYQSVDAFHGVACKVDERWNVNVAIKTPASLGPSVGYETAETDRDSLISDYIAHSMAGDALDLEQEKAAIATGWK